MRRLVPAATVALALALPAGAAAAWTQIGAAGPATVPSLLVTRDGTLLVSFESTTGATISLARAGGAPRVLVSGDPVAGRTQLLQLPNGQIELYFPNAQGVARLASSDDGLSWTGPVQTRSHTTGGVEASAVAPDGTPYWSQDGTGFVNVFRGLDGDAVQNVYTRCCGYHESLAVDSSGLVQVAFYSNADPDGAAVYEALDGALQPGSPMPLKPVAEHEAPLVADRAGNTFLAWAPGYPSATGLLVEPYRGGLPAGDGPRFAGSFQGGDPHMALAVDTVDRIWAVWSQGGTIHAARSSSHGAHFGAVVSSAFGGAADGIAAAAVPGDPGTVEVVVNTGSELVGQQLEPGLSVRVSRTAKQVGGRTVVTRWAQALDDGIGVGDATFTVGGRTVHADGSGRAKVPPGRGRAAAPGYVGAAFRIR